jgi:flagellar basal-body rod protein FlgB
MCLRRTSPTWTRRIITPRTSSSTRYSAAGSSSGNVTGEESQSWADKNNVELDQEVAKMTENAMLFEAGVTLLKKKIQMFKNALKTS